ncbi:MAG TPA: hypothetical protein VM715_00370 [Candidatus Acidoferrum sp.]|nr:hypothetical protein [Candidatus Acidoferrum sp.]
MKDIPIIFELVIVGFEVLAWIFLLALSLFGYKWIELDFVTQWATQLSFGLLGLAYMFGVIFDKAVSSLPFGWIVGHGAVAETADLPSPLRMRMQVLARNPEIYNELQKRINQHRMVRSTVFNFTLISLSALLFVFTRFGFDLRLFGLLVFLSTVFVSLTLFTGRQSARTLMLELQYASEELNRKDGESPNMPNP